MHLSEAFLSLLSLAAAVVSAQNNSTVPISVKDHSKLYPPYKYRPSVFADWKPHPWGSVCHHHNGSLNPLEPKKHHGHHPPHGPPGLPPIGPGNNYSSFWYEEIEHNGISPFIEDGASWKVYRNVKEYGAKGDGATDDSAAIQAAINDGGRGPGGNGRGTTGAPAVIYFPTGTYLMISPVQLYVDTVFIGNPINRPILKASANYDGMYLVYAKDPAFDATTNFYIGIKNFIFDSTSVASNVSFTLLDWSVSQATQLTNNLFRMPRGSLHTGVATPEGGSGTSMGNLDFEGGAVGLDFNNQQYSIKDVTFTGCRTGVAISHGFDIVFQGLRFKDCNLGINATAGGVGNVGSYTLVDSVAETVKTLILTKSQTVSPSNSTNSSTTGDDSLVIDNLRVSNVDKTVVAGNMTLLTGGVDKTWVYGNAYLNNGPVGGAHANGVLYDTSRSPPLTASGGEYFTMAPPTYQEYRVKEVVNIKTVPDYPVYGDGQTDDTDNINAILARNAGSAVTFFPAGTYLVTSTIKVPPGSRIIGEAWSAISAVGDYFSDASNPQPMVQVGRPGEIGLAQFSDMLFTVADVLPGCILVEVNMAGLKPGDVGFWDSHFRVGGAAGSAVETKCTDPFAPCKAAFLLLHLTPWASAYIENMWGWTADHDLDGVNDQTIATGRGILVQSQRPVWLIGTAFEHNTLYQYNLVNAQNLFIGMQQSETPYWQGVGSPALAPEPWFSSSSFSSSSSSSNSSNSTSTNPFSSSDPDFSHCHPTDANCRMAWYQRIQGGYGLHIYGSGFWTFFNNRSGDCRGVDDTCQTHAVEIVVALDSSASLSLQELYWWTLNTRGCLNVIVGVDERGGRHHHHHHGHVDDGHVGVNVLVTRNNNPGSWGAVVAAFLKYSRVW